MFQGLPDGERDFVELILKHIPCNSSDSATYKNLTDPKIIDKAYCQFKSRNSLLDLKRKHKMEYLE